SRSAPPSISGCAGRRPWPVPPGWQRARRFPSPLFPRRARTTARGTLRRTARPLLAQVPIYASWHLPVSADMLRPGATACLSGYDRFTVCSLIGLLRLLRHVLARPDGRRAARLRGPHAQQSMPGRETNQVAGVVTPELAVDAIHVRLDGLARD